MLVGRPLRLFGIAGLLSGLIAACPVPAASTDGDDLWRGLVQDIFSNRSMNDGSDVIAIEMPSRAEDAAMVPVTLRTRLASTDSRRVLTITLVIDQNPAPMAARFELGPDAHVSETGSDEIEAVRTLRARVCGPLPRDADHDRSPQ